MMGDVMENLIGLGVSLAYVLAVLGASSLAARTRILPLRC